jgi:class 3 adenylate cyclase
VGHPEESVLSLLRLLADGGLLANMSEVDLRADTPPVDWSDLSVTELLPTGTVTLLLADVEGSTRLWQTQTR